MASLPDFRPTGLLVSLGRGEVDFVVIGGVAVVLQGSPRFTRDLDICYSTAAINLARLGDVLVALDARLRGIEEDLPFVPDARTLRHTAMLTLTTSEGNLDLLANPPGAPTYAALRRRADLVDLDGVSVRVASLEDLLAMKRAAARPQDEVDVEALEVARSRLRGRRRSSGA